MIDRKARDNEIIRDMLVRVGESEHVNQRALSKELGIALGMTNTYIRRCIRKGLIKISEIPPNRYAYYLTPKGFTEKSRLTAEFLSDSLTFFRSARVQYTEIYNQCLESGWKNLALAGASDLAEIAVLSARDHGVNLRGIISNENNDKNLSGLQIVSSIEELGEIQAVVLTEVNAPQAVYDNLITHISHRRVLNPPILKIKKYIEETV